MNQDMYSLEARTENSINCSYESCLSIILNCPYFGETVPIVYKLVNFAVINLFLTELYKNMMHCSVTYTNEQYLMSRET